MRGLLFPQIKRRSLPSQGGHLVARRRELGVLLCRAGGIPGSIEISFDRTSEVTLAGDIGRVGI